MAPQLVPADGGWHEWRDGTTPPRRRGRSRVLVHLTEARDGRVHLDGLRIDGPVSASLLRSVPVGRIEAAANAQFHGGAPAGKGRATSARIPNSLRAGSPQGYPDGFYEVVGKAYQALARSSSKPVADLADANDVPVTTAQRWVREARRRGKLPPGRPGKAG